VRDCAARMAAQIGGSVLSENRERSSLPDRQPRQGGIRGSGAVLQTFRSAIDDAHRALIRSRRTVTAPVPGLSCSRLVPRPQDRPLPRRSCSPSNRDERGSAPRWPSDRAARARPYVPPINSRRRFASPARGTRLRMPISQPNRDHRIAVQMNARPSFEMQVDHVFGRIETLARSFDERAKLRVAELFVVAPRVHQKISRASVEVERARRAGRRLDLALWQDSAVCLAVTTNCLPSQSPSGSPPSLWVKSGSIG